MLKKIASHWWMFALRGVIAVIFGIIALIKPDQTMQILVLAFGAFSLMDGLLAIFAGISLAPIFNRWWAMLLEGIAGVIIGLLTFFWPNITALALLYIIGSWALITGIFEIVSAIQLRREITGEWMMILSGLLSIIFGVLVFVFPITGALSVIWMIGVYAVFFGTAEIIFAFRMNSLRKEVEKAIAVGG